MIRFSALVLLLAGTAYPAMAQTAPEPGAAEAPIVVTGRPLSATAKELVDCLARNCPPDQDIAATLAHADNQFLAGDYNDARDTLRHSLGRNKREAKDYPVAVSTLYRGAATVDRHMGERDSYLRNTVGVRESLEASLPDSDPRVLVADIEVGDMRARLGYPDEAERYYKRVAAQAAELNQPLVVGLAQIRQAMLLTQRVENGAGGPAGLKSEARKIAIAMLGSSERPADPRLRVAAYSILSRIDRDRENNPWAEELLAAAQTMTRKAGQRPALLIAEPIRDPGSYADTIRAGYGEGSDGGNILKRLTTVGAGDWVDIGFWVRPDGTVSDPAVLRQSGQAGWIKPVVEQISSRQYSRMNAEPGDPGFYMLERYTLTADLQTQVTGTRIRQRSPVRRYERLDLTIEEPTAARS